MLIQAVIYGVLVTLTLVAVAEAIRTCCQDDKTKKTARVWSAPVRALKSKLKGMKTLKEETPTPAPAPAQPPAPAPTVETV